MTSQKNFFPTNNLAGIFFAKARRLVEVIKMLDATAVPPLLKRSGFFLRLRGASLVQMKIF